MVVELVMVALVVETVVEVVVEVVLVVVVEVMVVTGVRVVGRLVGGSDLGGRRGDRESSALGWRFAALCRWEGVIRVVGGEIGNLVPWGGVSPHCWGMGGYGHLRSHILAA